MRQTLVAAERTTLTPTFVSLMQELTVMDDRFVRLAAVDARCS